MLVLAGERPRYGGAVWGDDGTVHERSPLLQAIAEVDADAWGHLTSALEDGQAELHAAEPNDAWNVIARFYPRTGRFGASNLEGQPRLPHDGLPSDLVSAPHARGILDDAAMGHGEVVVILSMVPYLRAGYEASPEAVAKALLNEAWRVVNLGLWVGEATRRLLTLCHDTSSSGRPKVTNRS